MQPLGLGDIRSYPLTAFIILTNTQVDTCIGLPNTITSYLAMQGIMYLASSFTTNISHLLHFLWGKDSDQSFLFNGYCIWFQDMVKMVQDAVAKYQNLMKQLYQMLHLPTTLTINLNSIHDSLDDQQKEAEVTMLNSEVFYTIEDNQSCFKLATIIALLKLFKRFLLINVDYFNKMTSTSGKDKLIPYRLPPKVSQMSVDYSCIVQPILCKLFHIGLQKLDTDNLTQKLQFETQMHLKITPRFGTADMQ
ncbi:hypothetical protein FRB99_007139 [Tulasnella sp. 403]|nr:hypothetical protein FRB99_007139 [Tulasnella sp. 403]